MRQATAVNMKRASASTASALSRPGGCIETFHATVYDSYLERNQILFGYEPLDLCGGGNNRDDAMKDAVPDRTLCGRQHKPSMSPLVSYDCSSTVHKLLRLITQLPPSQNVRSTGMSVRAFKRITQGVSEVTGSVTPRRLPATRPALYASSPTLPTIASSSATRRAETIAG